MQFNQVGTLLHGAESSMREADSCSASQEIPCFVWNLKIHYMFTEAHYWILSLVNWNLSTALCLGY